MVFYFTPAEYIEIGFFVSDSNAADMRMIGAGTERHDGCVKKDNLALEEELPQYF